MNPPRIGRLAQSKAPTSATIDLVFTNRAASHSPEQFVAEVRRSELGLIGIGVRLIVISALAGAGWAAIDAWFPAKSAWLTGAKWTLVALVTIFLLVSVVRRFVGWSNARLEVTDHRIRIRYRLRKAGWDIPLLTIVDVTHQSGPIQRIFGVGVLQVQTSFAPLPAVMFDVASVEQLRQEILALRTQAWERHLRPAAPPASSGELRAAS